MVKYTEQNKIAWEYNAYDFWVRQTGTPAERAKKDLENPRGMLKNYSKYFEDVKGIKIANICGSCGKKAIPLSILGASVIIFDISEENKRYALETAEAAGTYIDYIVDDEKRKNFPKCYIRRYTLSEIINSAINSGFIIKNFDEHPSWTNKELPGEFTLVADKIIQSAHI